MVGGWELGEKAGVSPLKVGGWCATRTYRRKPFPDMVPIIAEG
jgi:hypothetical protein